MTKKYLKNLKIISKMRLKFEISCHMLGYMDCLEDVAYYVYTGVKPKNLKILTKKGEGFFDRSAWIEIQKHIHIAWHYQAEKYLKNKKENK